MKNKPLSLVLLISFSLLVIGCGSSGNSTSTASTSEASQDKQLPSWKKTAQNGSPEEIKKLLNSTDKSPERILDVAVKHNKPKSIEIIANKVKENSPTGILKVEESFNEALKGTSNPEVLQLILNKSESSVESINPSPLITATKHNENPKIINFLVNNGAKINVKDDNGNLPLDHAFENDSLGEEVYGKLRPRTQFSKSEPSEWKSTENKEPTLITTSWKNIHFERFKRESLTFNGLKDVYFQHFYPEKYQELNNNEFLSTSDYKDKRSKYLEKLREEISNHPINVTYEHNPDCSLGAGTSKEDCNPSEGNYKFREYNPEKGKFPIKVSWDEFKFESQRSLDAESDVYFPNYYSIKFNEKIKAPPIELQSTKAKKFIEERTNQWDQVNRKVHTTLGFKLLGDPSVKLEDPLYSTDEGKLINIEIKAKPKFIKVWDSKSKNDLLSEKKF